MATHTLEHTLEIVSEGDIQTDSKGYVDTDLKYFFSPNELKDGIKEGDKLVKIKPDDEELKKKIKIFDTFLAYRNFLVDAGRDKY